MSHGQTCERIITIAVDLACRAFPSLTDRISDTPPGSGATIEALQRMTDTPPPSPASLARGRQKLFELLEARRHTQTP